MKILLAGDEPETGRLLNESLRRDGLTVDSVRSLEEARAALALAQYRVLVLDRRLQDGDGLELLRGLSAGPGRPWVLVLGARHAAADRIHTLNAGADDCLGKPFDPDELRARIRAALRRGSGAAGPVICGRLSYQPATGEIAVGGVPLSLRRREAALLGALLERARRVVRRSALLNEVYAFDEEPSSNTLDAHVSRLRRRLEANAARVTIRPVRGVGYVLDAA